MDGFWEFLEGMYYMLEDAGVYSFLDKVGPYVIGFAAGLVAFILYEWWESGLPLLEYLKKTMFVEVEEEDRKGGGQSDRA